LKDEILDFKIHENLILAAYKEGSLYCFDQNDYSIKWSLELGELISAPIFIDNNMVIIPAGSGLKRSVLFFISINDGKILKNINMKGTIHSKPVSYKNYCLIGSDDKKLYCIDKENKDIIWSFKTKGSIKITPIVDNNIIYLNSNDGKIYALNLDGKLIWKKHISNIKTTPLIHENNIIFSSDYNLIFCLDKNNGNLLWFHELKNEAFDMKMISNKVIVGCAQGYLISLDINNGKIIDCFKVTNQNIKEIDEHENKLLIKLENGKSYLV